MTRADLLRFTAALALSLIVTPITTARAEGLAIPTPRIVIYPGDIISDGMLTDTPAGSIDAPEGIAARQRESLVGKMARRTLLPGRAIPLSAVGNPRLVRNGARVTLTYFEAGVAIATVGDAMQDGSVGQVVRVRNADSGVVVSGVVQQDGTIRVRG
jgi:flagella basal body P-ring formation protein FlgA